MNSIAIAHKYFGYCSLLVKSLHQPTILRSIIRLTDLLAMTIFKWFFMCVKIWFFRRIYRGKFLLAIYRLDRLWTNVRRIWTYLWNIWRVAIIPSIILTRITILRIIRNRSVIIWVKFWKLHFLRPSVFPILDLDLAIRKIILLKPKRIEISKSTEFLI